MTSLPAPKPALEHVTLEGLKVARVSVRISKWHDPFELFLVDAGMRFYVADNRLGKGWIFRHKSFARVLEYAMRKAAAYARAEWAAFNRKKTLNG